MNVGELRELIKDVPDNEIVCLELNDNWIEPASKTWVNGMCGFVISCESDEEEE
ncbi:hypothetical protein LHA31_02630 [Carnobacterium viridans]|uniref:Uncharacterized protein n=1 Tax=Carnobacterium viridans TaxID=174587 RepID=A0A1H1BS03_9LACT|nr:hypothetical protein [Carnobacterium viridans]UDE95691.1 hypothetical protein LHA31_02630 [Carnobacterium viridans]SDQ54176.1 hypothetical protein SAMN04487752_2692 [Carnobacterium viridans]